LSFRWGANYPLTKLGMIFISYQWGGKSLFCRAISLLVKG